jgi:DnaJ-class molecular chaperone
MTRRNAKTPGPAESSRNPGDEARPGSPQTGEQICPDCRGSGRRGRKPCETCGGTGRVVRIVGDA